MIYELFTKAAYHSRVRETKWRLSNKNDGVTRLDITYFQFVNEKQIPERSRTIFK